MNQEKIMDYWQSPVFKGPPTFVPTHTGFAENPDCGDVLRIDFRLVDGKMECVAFDGKGCVLSQAGGSMLAEFIHDHTLSEFQDMKPAQYLELIEKLYEGRPIPVRMGCCLLPVRALLNAKPVPVVE